MNRSTTRFLQFVIVLIGIIGLGLMLWEPHLEGRNAQATLFQVYFNDPFLAYAYIASIPVFVALYQAYTALGAVGQNGAFSQGTVKALRIIKFCALTVVGFVMGGEAWLFLVQSRIAEDIAGGVAIGLFFILVFAVIALAAAIFERTLQTAPAPRR